jgi:hypothetical protein
MCEHLNVQQFSSNDTLDPKQRGEGKETRDGEGRGRKERRGVPFCDPRIMITLHYLFELEQISFELNKN